MNSDRYGLMAEQIRALAGEDPCFLPLMANTSALLKDALERINWAGFYIVRNGILVLGPFQGKTACIHIPKGKGVCGTAWEKDETQLVADVHAFPGHIACDSASRSEIVIPLHDRGKVSAVMDIDSPEEGRFTEEDRRGLEGLARCMEELIVW